MNLQDIWPNLFVFCGDYPLIDVRVSRPWNEVEIVTEPGHSALVVAARCGDKEAFAALIQEHRPRLVALCRRALGEAELAEDAAQEAILLALTSLDRLRQIERFGSWLAGIGLNVCRRWRRERTSASWSWEALQGGRVDDWPVRGPGPEELAEVADEARLVRAAIGELPPGQRAAVALYYLVDLSQSEIAKQAGTSVGAVRVRLYEGRTQLRKRLASGERSRV